MAVKKDNFWDNFWSNNNYLYFQNNTDSWVNLVIKYNYETVRSIIKKENKINDKILEIGCGSAKFTQFISNSKTKSTISDININILKQAKDILNSLKIKTNTIQLDLSRKFNHKETYDVVFSGGVLEFFEDIDTPINNMYKLTSQKGLCLAIVIPRKISIQTIANIQKSIVYLFRNILLLKKIKFNNLIYDHVDKSTYANSYNYKIYKKSFLDAGFNQVKVYSLTPFPSFAIGKKLDSVYAKLINKFFSNFIFSFNKSTSPLSIFWGSAFLVYAKKN